MSEKPIRIQRKRSKGWKVPPDTIYVGRGSSFGNPFRADECRAAGYSGTDAEISERCVEAFRGWLGPFWRNNWDGRVSELARESLFKNLHKLRGKNLACWCPLDQPCHADVLLELANKGSSQ